MILHAPLALLAGLFVLSLQLAPPPAASPLVPDAQALSLLASR